MNTRNRHRLSPTQRLTNHNMPVNYTYMTNVLENHMLANPIRAYYRKLPV